MFFNKIMTVVALVIGFVGSVKACDVDIMSEYKGSKNFYEMIAPMYQSVSQVNGGFVVLPMHGNYFLSSTNGSNWSLSRFDLPYYIAIRSVVFFDSKYYAHSTDNLKVDVSKDLGGWERHDKEKPGVFHKLMYANNRLVAIPSVGIERRPAVFSFMRESRKYKYLEHIRLTGHGGTHLSVSMKGGWETSMPVPFSHDVEWTGDRYLLLTFFDGVYESFNALDWTPTGLNPSKERFVSSVAGKDDLTVAVGDHGLIMLRKEDGAPWEEVKAGITANLYGVEWDGRRFLAVGDCGTVIASEDGGHWETLRTAVNERLLDVAYNGEHYVAIGFGLTPEKDEIEGRVLVSDDGRSWQRVGPLSSEVVALP